MRRTLLSLALALTLGFACGGGSSRKETPVEAIATLKDMINSTATVVAPGQPIKSVRDQPDPEACVGNFGNDKGTVSFSYRVNITPRPNAASDELVERARTRWGAEGYEIGTVGRAPDPSVRSLTAKRDGYGVIISIEPEQVSVAGSTPCIKDPSQRSG